CDAAQPRRVARARQRTAELEGLERSVSPHSAAGTPESWHPFSEVPMLTRRELLSRATTTLLLIPILSSCSNSSSPSPDAAPACTGVDTTSTVSAAHTHTVCVLTSDLTAPPAAGVTYHTSVDGNHDHTVTLSQAQLQSIEAGTAVTVTSSNT